jgi:carboxylesterase type B
MSYYFELLHFCELALCLFSGEEDCLYLNVYSPNLSPDKLLPAMIYIHGGAFMYGSGANYGPANCMDWDMVVITLNYRLGALGE